MGRLQAAVRAAAAYATDAATGCPAPSVSVKLLAVIVPAFIASRNVARTSGQIGAASAPSAGQTISTRGGLLTANAAEVAVALWKPSLAITRTRHCAQFAYCVVSSASCCAAVASATACHVAPLSGLSSTVYSSAAPASASLPVHCTGIDPL